MVHAGAGGGALPNVAVTLTDRFTLSVAGFCAPVRSPLQPRKFRRLEDGAVKVTLVPQV